MKRSGWFLLVLGLAVAGVAFVYLQNIHRVEHGTLRERASVWVDSFRSSRWEQRKSELRILLFLGGLLTVAGGAIVIAKAGK